MDTFGIVLIIMGIVSIAVGILGKYRPDIIYRNWDKGSAFGGSIRLFGFSAARFGGDKMPLEQKQRFGFVVFALFGVMLILASIACSIPQWEVYKDAITISIVMVMTAVLLFSYWKIVLSQNEGAGRIGFVIVMLLSLSMIAISVYYWYLILN